MLRAVLGLVKSDLERQVHWAAQEFRRSGRSAVVTSVLAAAGALAAIGTGVVGCIALYGWVAARHGEMAGLAAVAGVLGLAALVLLCLAFLRPQPVTMLRPAMRATDPEALKQAVGQDLSAGTDQALAFAKSSSLGPAIIAGEEALRTGSTLYRAARTHLRGGSTGTIIGSIAVAAVLGLVVGRRL